MRDIATRLGLSMLSDDPVRAAETIARRARRLPTRRIAIVASLAGASPWDLSVARELIGLSNDFILVLIGSSGWSDGEASVLEIGEELTDAEESRWLSAAADDVRARLRTHDLHSIHSWWEDACRGAISTEAPRAVRDAALDIVGVLTLAGRSLFVEQFDPLEPVEGTTVTVTDAIAELLRTERVRLEGSLVVLVEPPDRANEVSARVSDRMAAARALQRCGARDPWALLRAAELLLEAGDHEAAEALVVEVNGNVINAELRQEIGDRWLAATSQIGGEVGHALAMRAAQRALDAGEAQEAKRWCEAAAKVRPEAPRLALVLGRASIELGDFVAGALALDRAMSLAAGDEALEAEIQAALAELYYLQGRLGEASRCAHDVATRAVSSSARLMARNTLGKILLAEGRWEAADEHFAADALAASAAENPTAELRSRLNRAIALISKGLYDSARAILERVAEDGARSGEARACAHAHSNLGVIAYYQRDYGAALHHWETTTRFPDSLRNRLSTAHTIANLASLRLRLGLLDHAEHTARFGQKLIANALVPVRQAHFRVVRARIALARGETERARRNAEAAVSEARAAGDQEHLIVALLARGRTALEEGHLDRVGTVLEELATLPMNACAKAEMAIIHAHRVRGRGDDARACTEEALGVARSANDDELVGESLALLATLFWNDGESERARSCLIEAIAIRDEVAASLPDDVKSAFLAKAESLALARLQAAIENDHPPERPSPSARRSTPPASTRLLVGNDPQIRSLLATVGRVARTDTAVLIQGESGTGKELVAEALHRMSGRAERHLVRINCAALSETLLLSELFGHEKGAFTGASARRRGRFEIADGGTLFLDEIGDVSLRTQAALLRVLQEKTFERVGGTATIRCDVRVITATHRDLPAMVARGEFREDLYYRIRGVALQIPPLRARIADLPLIATALLARIAADRGEEPPKHLSEEAIRLLARHRWPGNVRELENVLRTASVFADTDTIPASTLIENVEELCRLARTTETVHTTDLRPTSSVSDDEDDPDDDSRSDVTAKPPSDDADTSALYTHLRRRAVPLSTLKRQIERQCIEHALTESGGNITRAAELLGMRRPRLSQLVKQYRLNATSEDER